MSMWTFLIVATAVWGGVELFTKIFENDKEARIAKIEAALKRDLVKQLGDPDLVARVIEARLPRVGPDGEPIDLATTHAADLDPASPTDAARYGRAEGKSSDDKIADAGSGLLLGGMVCSLVGIGFLILSMAVDDDFIVPGILVTAVGFALLAYPSARDEIARTRRRRRENHAEA